MSQPEYIDCHGSLATHLPLMTFLPTMQNNRSCSKNLEKEQLHHITSPRREIYFISAKIAFVPQLGRFEFTFTAPPLPHLQNSPSRRPPSQPLTLSYATSGPPSGYASGSSSSRPNLGEVDRPQLKPMAGGYHYIRAVCRVCQLSWK